MTHLPGQRFLFLGAHCDDVEIGGGGTAAKLQSAGREIAFAVAADCGSERKAEARAAAALLGLNDQNRRLFLGFIPDARLAERTDVLANWLKDILAQFRPETVFVHHGADTHPDHEALYKAAIRVFVEQSIYLYSIPKLAGQVTPFLPNHYEDITAFLDPKLALCACHHSQAGKGIYLDPDQIRDVARMTFRTAFGRSGGYAEAFRLHVTRSQPGSFPRSAPEAGPAGGAQPPAASNIAAAVFDQRGQHVTREINIAGSANVTVHAEKSLDLPQNNGLSMPNESPRQNPRGEESSGRELPKSLLAEPERILLTELARVYSEPVVTRALLLRTGLISCNVSAPGTDSDVLWTLIAEQMDAGKEPDALRKLMRTVQKAYSGNAVFRQYRIDDGRIDDAPNHPAAAHSPSEDEVIDLLAGIRSFQMDEFKVVGHYFRFQQNVVTELRRSAQKVVQDCQGRGQLYHNYLVWGSSGEGKTYFATETAQDAQIPCGKISLASPKDVPSEAALKAHLAGALQQTGPYLFIIDEADKRDEPWICSALFDSLSSRKSNPKGNTVFLLIGSTGHSLEEFWTGMEAHTGGRDLKTRIPPNQMMILPTTTLGDRLLVVLGQIRKQASQLSHPVSIIDKLALAYALLSPNGATPRGLEGLVVKAVGHLASTDRELRYGHFFGPGDDEGARFIHLYPNLYRTLQNDSLRLT